MREGRGGGGQGVILFIQPTVRKRITFPFAADTGCYNCPIFMSQQARNEEEQKAQFTETMFDSRFRQGSLAGEALDKRQAKGSPWALAGSDHYY